MLGGDDNQRGLVDTAVLDLVNHLSNRVVDKLNFTEQGRGWRSGRVHISAGGGVGLALFDELLAHADSLEIHAQDIGSPGPFAIVILASQLVQNGIDLELV